MELSRLVHFRFVVGSHHSCIISRLPHELAVKFELQERSLKYVNGEGIPSQIKEVLQHATALCLDRHLTLTKLSEFGIGNMKKLEFCVLGNVIRLKPLLMEQKIVNKEKMMEMFMEKIFLDLYNSLRLHYMKNLVSIWTGPVWKGCLSSLKSLALHECPQLTTILLWILLNIDHSLENISPNLRKISLHYMPKLADWWSSLKWSSYFGFTEQHNVFIPIKRDADLTTRLEEIENQLLAQKQERKRSGDFMEAPTFEATTASKEKQLGTTGAAAGAAVYEGRRSLLTSISSKIAYMKDLKASNENLTWETMELLALKDAIEMEISRYTIRPATRRWLAKVKMMEREVGN
ncbi:hypothetical protein AAG906_014827 [Vitis piasezkii]